jgi:hypothetical protein
VPEVDPRLYELADIELASFDRLGGGRRPAALVDAGASAVGSAMQ